MPLFSFLLFLFCAQFNTAAAEEKLTATSFALNASYKVDATWATTFQATVTLENQTSSPTSSWTATFTMPQGYTLSSHVSYGIFKVSGQTVTVKNTSGNGVIPTGGSTTFNMMIYMPRSLPTVISNLQAVANGSITPPPNPPITPSEVIEHSAWYIDWTSWFTGPPYVIPAGNDVLNVFVGKIMFGTDGKPTLGGFGNMTNDQLTLFTAYCAAQQPPIAVKVSLGGAGGMYDHCWDLLTLSNVQSFAQGAADFCHDYGFAGVDFDYEAFTSAEQETLVGLFIKQFKAIDPKFQTSICVNAGFGPNYPWQAAAKNILDAATLTSENNAVDKVYIMSYYNSLQEEQNWVIGWANWLEQTYGFTPARVGVGIDDFEAHAYDPLVFAAWAATKGYSTAHWAFDPAHPK